MPMDYEVFEPNDEHLADIIVRILEKRGYNAGYQRSYQNHKIFIKVDTQEEADRISRIIKSFMEKFRRNESGITAYRLDSSISKLGNLIPETSKRKREKVVEHIENKIENENYDNPQLPETEIYYNKLEEWRMKIVERLNLLDRQMKEKPRDPLNEKRQIERDTLVWVLSVMP